MNSGKLCPAGWRVPNDNDWSTLYSYLGGLNVAGGKLKETGTTHWSSPNEGASDEYGFKALPAGCFNTQTYMGINNSCFFWSTNEATDTLYASHFYMNAYTAVMYHYPQGDKQFGLSVRCIKN